jgi:hypothetical protein
MFGSITHEATGKPYHKCAPCDVADKSRFIPSRGKSPTGPGVMSAPTTRDQVFRHCCAALFQMRWWTHRIRSSLSGPRLVPTQQVRRGRPHRRFRPVHAPGYAPRGHAQQGRCAGSRTGGRHTAFPRMDVRFPLNGYNRCDVLQAHVKELFDHPMYRRVAI